jgi:hypothetical protein
MTNTTVMAERGGSSYPADHNAINREAAALFGGIHGIDLNCGIIEVPATGELEVITTLEQLADLVAGDSPMYLRYFQGPGRGCCEGSQPRLRGRRDIAWTVGHHDRPGTMVPRAVEEWVARRICKYGELAEEDDRYAWLLKGIIVGRGPDHEPLLTDIRPLARLSRAVLEQATLLYHERFEVGNDSRSDDD